MKQDLREVLVHVVILAIVSVLAAFLVVPFDTVGQEPLAVGEVAPRTVQAPRGFSYADDEETARRVATARSAVPEVYIFDAMAADNAERMIREAFGNARADIANNLTGQTPTLSDDAIMDALSRFDYTESANVAPLMANEFDVTSETATQMVDSLCYPISQVDEVPACRFSVLIQDDMNPSERVVEDVSAVKTVSSAHRYSEEQHDPLSRALATVSR